MEEQRLAAGPPSGSQHAAQLEQQQAEGASLGQEQLSAGHRNRNTYSDHFMMFTFKVEMCQRVDKHDREQCPYAHPGELARRRHPSLYQALPCPEARAKKICPRLENCNCSHSTFEFWLHPDRYKTFLCERGEGCNRPICFFAHSPTELRELPQGLQRTQPAPWPTTSAAAPAGSSNSSSQQGASGEAVSSPVWQAAATGQAAPAGPGSRPNQHQPQLQTRPGEQRMGAQQVPGAQASAPRAGGARMMMFSPVMPLRPSDSQTGRGVVRPEGHRGATVAVIPAGPSVWQNNALMQSEAGEAPNLEELCAAVARVSMQQVDPRVDAVAVQQYQQAYSQQGMVMQQQQQQQAAVLQSPEVLSAQTPMMVLSPQQMLPPLTAMSGLAALQLQQQQAGQPLQQQVLLPNGQVVLVQMPPREEGRAADPSPWGAM